MLTQNQTDPEAATGAPADAAAATDQAPGSTESALEDVVQTAGQVWRTELFQIGDTAIQVSQIVIALAMLILGIFVAKAVARQVGTRVLARMGLESGPRHAIQTILFYLLLFGVVMLSLQTAGVPLTVFTIFGGALALGIGFGSQNIMNNFISGLILLIERPIALEQTVELGGDTGRVTKIGARSTHLEGYQGETMIVPNSMLLENTVKNWSLPDRRQRSVVGVGVAYGSDTAMVKQILLDAMGAHEKIMDQEQSVLFTEFGDNALAFEAHFWSKPSWLLERLTTESELRFAIDAACRAAGVCIAFPQRDLHLDTLTPLEVRMVSAD